jgi:hypothetical protein
MPGDVRSAAKQLARCLRDALWFALVSALQSRAILLLRVRTRDRILPRAANRLVGVAAAPGLGVGHRRGRDAGCWRTAAEGEEGWA